MECRWTRTSPRRSKLHLPSEGSQIQLFKKNLRGSTATIIVLCHKWLRNQTSLEASIWASCWVQFTSITVEHNSNKKYALWSIWLYAIVLLTNTSPSILPRWLWSWFQPMRTSRKCTSLTVMRKIKISYCTQLRTSQISSWINDACLHCLQKKVFSFRYEWRIIIIDSFLQAIYFDVHCIV